MDHQRSKHVGKPLDVVQEESAWWHQVGSRCGEDTVQHAACSMAVAECMETCSLHVVTWQGSCVARCG